MQRSCTLKHINIVVWEALNISRFVDEKLAWDGMNNEEKMFFTPPESLINDDASLNVVSISFKS